MYDRSSEKYSPRERERILETIGEIFSLKHVFLAVENNDCSEINIENIIGE